MELNVGPNHDWSIHSRVEDQVNNHMADIAVETLQQRLSSVSEQMHTLAGHVSQRSAEEFKEEPRTEDFRRGEEPLSSACGTGAPDRFTIAAPTGTRALFFALTHYMITFKSSDVLLEPFSCQLPIRFKLLKKKTKLFEPTYIFFKQEYIYSYFKMYMPMQIMYF